MSGGWAVKVKRRGVVRAGDRACYAALDGRMLSKLMRKNIEAYARYYRVKEELTEYIQIGAAALELLARNVSVANGPSLLGGIR